MKKFCLVTLIIACLGLTACGVKGPLYYPEQPQQSDTLSQ